MMHELTTMHDYAAMHDILCESDVIYGINAVHDIHDIIHASGLRVMYDVHYHARRSTVILWLIMHDVPVTVTVA